MNLLNVLVESIGASFATPQSIDSIIVSFFNDLGWWGNLILLFVSLFLATLFGGILGYQREVNGHPAGFRTHVLISLGSALIMILSIYGVPGGASRDPMRLAAAGVTGIGFLGTGSIIKNGVTIKGLTTAATIWVTMAVGMSCGAGYFVIGTITTIISLVALIIFKHIENWASKKSTNIIILVKSDFPVFKDLIPLLEKYEIAYKDFDTTLVEEFGNQVLRVHFKCVEKNRDAVNLFIQEFRETCQPIDVSIIK